MTRTTKHLRAAALGLMLALPALAHAQTVSERPAPAASADSTSATTTAVPSGRPTTRSRVAAAHGSKGVVKVESKHAAVTKRDLAERLRRRRPER